MYDSLKTEKDAISQHTDSHFVSSPNWPQFAISLKQPINQSLSQTNLEIH